MDSSQVKRLISHASTHDEANSLIAWSTATVQKIHRGDMAFGILPVAEASMVPEALHKALAIGVAQAGPLLADWLLRPFTGEPDPIGADAALLRAIELGLGEASLPLMRCRWFFRRESCTAQEAEQAFTLLEMWSAYRPGNSEALYLLGLVTYAGFGTDAAPGRSAELISCAARQGSADAMVELFIYYANGIGVVQNEARAIDYLRQAAEAGQTRAMYNLGALHATGRYVPKDINLAVEWYARAAEQGHERAAETLVTMYEKGLGVAPDQARATYFRELIE